MSDFIPTAAEWVTKLTDDELPDRVVRAAKAQLQSTVGAALWTVPHPIGAGVVEMADDVGTGAEATFLPTGEQLSAKGAAFGHSALSMAMDFDDTVLGGHTGHSATAVALAYGEKFDASGREVLVAAVAANEVGARLASAAAVGPFRGQQTAYIHAVEAAVARSVLAGLDAETTADAIGMALGQPPWPLTPGFLGSDAKVFTAAGPVLAGLHAVDAATAGLSGNPDVVDGFLEEFSDYPLPEFLGGLGTRWHTAAITVKAHPGCAYVSPAIRAALDCAARLPDFTADEVASVDVYGSLFTVRVEDLAAEYVDGRESPLSALSFTVPYNVAIALLDGEHTPRQLSPERVGDSAVWAVADAVEVRHDADLTVAALESEVPVGAMLRRVGWRTIPYGFKVLGPVEFVRNLDVLLRFVRREPLPDSFDEARKEMGARVRVTLQDGTTVVEECAQPPGFAGQPLADIEGIAREKLVSGLAATDRDASLADYLGAIETVDTLDLASAI